METASRIGELLSDDERQRDAIHVAIAPVTASQQLSPGQHIGLLAPDSMELVGPCESNIGIVDPFLTQDVKEGQRFWMFLYPDSITSLRHIWSHPTFSTVAAKMREKLSHE